MFTKCLLVLTFLFMEIEAKIIETRYVDDAIALIDPETWFLVDLDNCMFEGTKPIGHANWYYDELQKRIEQGMSREEAIFDAYPVWMEAQQDNQVKPIEEKFIPALIELQKRGIIVMGLTHRRPCAVEITLNQISSLGFDFRTTAPLQENLEIPAAIPGLYENGILFVGDYNKKDDLLHAFITLTQQKPKKIVFIDDKRRNVEDLERLIEEGIDYTGVHYTAIEYVPPVYTKLQK